MAPESCNLKAAPFAPLDICFVHESISSMLPQYLSENDKAMKLGVLVLKSLAASRFMSIYPSRTVSYKVTSRIDIKGFPWTCCHVFMWLQEHMFTWRHGIWSNMDMKPNNSIWVARGILFHQPRHDLAQNQRAPFSTNIFTKDFWHLSGYVRSTHVMYGSARWVAASLQLKLLYHNGWRPGHTIARDVASHVWKGGTKRARFTMDGLYHFR